MLFRSQQLAPPSVPLSFPSPPHTISPPNPTDSPIVSHHTPSYPSPRVPVRLQPHRFSFSPSCPLCTRFSILCITQFSSVPDTKGLRRQGLSGLRSATPEESRSSSLLLRCWLFLDRQRVPIGIIGTKYIFNRTNDYVLEKSEKTLPRLFDTFLTGFDALFLPRNAFNELKL